MLSPLPWKIYERKVHACCRLLLFVTPWTIAHQAPLSMGFSRQEYWSGLPFLLQSSQPWDRTHVSCDSCIGRQILYHWATREDWRKRNSCKSYLCFVMLVMWMNSFFLLFSFFLSSPPHCLFLLPPLLLPVSVLSESPFWVQGCFVDKSQKKMKEEYLICVFGSSTLRHKKINLFCGCVFMSRFPLLHKEDKGFYWVTVSLLTPGNNEMGKWRHFKHQQNRQNLWRYDGLKNYCFINILVDKLLYFLPDLTYP